MKNGIRIVASGAMVVALLTLAGCEQKPKKPGVVSAVQRGMTPQQVVATIGKPYYVNCGRGMKLGWEEWIYPTGSIFIYRLRVEQILHRSPGTPPPPRVEEDQAVNNPFIPRDDFDEEGDKILPMSKKTNGVFGD